MAQNVTVKRLTSTLSCTTSAPLSNLLDQCILSKLLRDARRVHALILKSPFAQEVYIQNRLIDGYAKCGSLEDAQKVFDKMTERNIFSHNSVLTGVVRFGLIEEAVRVFGLVPEPDHCSWNSMVAGFAQHGRFGDAVEWFARMHEEGFVRDEYAFGSVLSACSGLEDVGMGMQVHGLLAKYPCSGDVYMGSALVDVYAKCGYVADARKVFDGMEEKNTVTWNTLITCYEQNGPVGEALEVFRKMMESGFRPNEVTLASITSACATLTGIREGEQIHAQALKSDVYRDDLILSNALIDMYAKCGRVNQARWVFDRMPVKNVVSETSMVSGYAKAASIEAAKSLFSRMMDRDIVVWNALMAGYAESGENEEAVSLFRLLKRDSVWPTHFTFANLLSACSNLADIRFGRQIHAHVLKHGTRFQTGPESDIFVGNALIDMYMKCGSIEDGCWAFDNMLERDKVSWNAMIVGFAQNGFGLEALEKFRRMLESGEQPDHITMIGVLSACSHAGLVKEGRQYFDSMTNQHGLAPLKDHYSCMVDLLGRAGCLQEAKALIDTMPMPPGKVIWASFLAACRVHRDIEMAKYVAEKLLEVDPSESGAYILISNLYAELGRWKDVNGVRKLMKEQGVVKQPGCSWIEVQNHVHVFMVKDRTHPFREDIRLLLLRLTKQMKVSGLKGDLEANDDHTDEISTYCYPSELLAGVG